MRSVSFNLERSQFLAGWREKPGTIFVPTLSDARIGDAVAIRLGIRGHAIRATLFGRVSLVRRVGRPTLPPGVEIHLEKRSLAAARFLAMAARGEPISFTERGPRWVSRTTLQVDHGVIRVEVTTENVSEGGCAVTWPGQLPPSGEEVRIRLKDGFFTRSLRAVVCWRAPGGERAGVVGLKLVADGRGGRAWRALVEAVAGSGARAI